MGSKVASMHCVLGCLCFMLVHVFSAAQDEDLRSKSSSVFIFLHVVLVKTAGCIKCHSDCVVNMVCCKKKTQSNKQTTTTLL